MSRLRNNEAFERETFAETMEALGVPIERRKAPEARVLSGWLRAKNRRTLVTGLNVGDRHMSLATSWAKRLKGESTRLYLQFRIIDYQGEPAILFRPDPRGYAVSPPRSKGKAWTMSISTKLKTAFNEHQVRRGCYDVHEIKDGYLAVFEEGY